MNEALNEMHEMINYGDAFGLRLYHNVEYEDWPEHWHVDIEIIMPREGGYKVCVGDRRYELDRGDIIIINTGVIHALEAPPDGERIILQFAPALLYNLKGLDTLIFRLEPVIYLSEREHTELWSRVRERMERIVREYDGADTFWEAAIHASLIEIYVELGRNTGGGVFLEGRLTEAESRIPNRKSIQKR